MTSPENNLPQNSADTSEFTPPIDELQGIQDPEFYAFMQKVIPEIQFTEEGEVDEKPTIRAVTGHLYQPETPEEFKVTDNLVADIRTKWEKLSYAGLYEVEKRGFHGRITDRDSIINGYTYLFAEKRIRQEAKKSRLSVRFSEAMKKSSDLWGENNRASAYKGASSYAEEREAQKESSDNREVIGTPIGERRYCWGDRKDLPLEEKLTAISLEVVQDMVEKANYSDARYAAFRRTKIDYRVYKIDEVVGNVIEYIRLANNKELSKMGEEEVRGGEFLLGLRIIEGYLRSNEGKISNLNELYKRVEELVEKNPHQFGLRQNSGVSEEE